MKWEIYSDVENIHHVSFHPVYAMQCYPTPSNALWAFTVHPIVAILLRRTLRTLSCFILINPLSTSSGVTMSKVINVCILVERRLVDNICGNWRLRTWQEFLQRLHSSRVAEEAVIGEFNVDNQVQITLSVALLKRHTLPADLEKLSRSQYVPFRLWVCELDTSAV